MEKILELKPNIIIGDFKEGALTLNAWDGFQSRQGYYSSKDSNEPSDVSCPLFTTSSLK